MTGGSSGDVDSRTADCLTCNSPGLSPKKITPIGAADNTQGFCI